MAISMTCLGGRWHSCIFLVRMLHLHGNNVANDLWQRLRVESVGWAKKHTTVTVKSFKLTIIESSLAHSKQMNALSSFVRLLKKGWCPALVCIVRRLVIKILFYGRVFFHVVQMLYISCICSEIRIYCDIRKCSEKQYALLFIVYAYSII